MSGPITPTTPNAAQASAPKGQVVQIVSLPDGLQDNARALRLDGEVVAQNKDGSVRIKTEQGEIDIQVRGRQPQVGAQIEVDIPAGHPPRQATIRAAPQPVTTLPLPPQTPTTSPVPLPTVPVTEQPDTQTPAAPQPVEADTGAPAPRPQAPAASPPAVAQPTRLPPLSVGQTVQLVPLPDAAPEIIVSPSAENADMPVADKAALAATQGAQKTQGSLIQNLLQAVKSVLPPAVVTEIETAMGEGAKPGSISAPALPDGETKPATAMPLQQPLVLKAKILSLVTPMDQRVFVAPAQAQGMPAATAAPGLAAPFTTLVADITAQNQPVVQVPMNTNTGAVQTFVMQASAASAPMGTQVTLLPQATDAQTLPGLSAQAAHPSVGQSALAPSATSLPPAWRTLLPLMQPSALWPVLDDMFQSFYQATPQAAQILGRIMPSPAQAQNLGPAILLFAAALKTGDMQGWLGDKKLEMLQKLGKGDLVSRLSGEATSLGQAADAAPTDWKSYPLPMLYQNEISKVLFHVRREPDEENAAARDDGATRFIMDVSLSRMGEVQLDATVRGNQVNIIVRTQMAVSLSMQDAMRSAYATALDNTNIYGEIGFQSDMSNFVQVLKREEALASA